MLTRVPCCELRESLLPAKKWSLDEEGKWRPQDGLEGTRYEAVKKYPLTPNLPSLELLDYDSNFKSNNWSREETELLWKLCNNFNLDFLVIHDRFNWEMRKKKRTAANYEPKTVEEIKERFFELRSKLIVNSSSSSSSSFVYDKELDQKRRMVLESYHARPLEQSQEEAFVVDYLAKLQKNGELEKRLGERIEIIKMLAGEQFTAGWPTLPELLKIASGKGVARLTEKSKSKKKKSSSNSGNSSNNNNTSSSSNNSNSSKQKKISSSDSTKSAASSNKTAKVKTSSPLANSGNFYLQSSQVHPLRVGSARAVEKILSDFDLPFKPDLPTAAVVKKFDQVRSAIIKLIDARKAAGLPPSKSLESSSSSANL